MKKLLLLATFVGVSSVSAFGAACAPGFLLGYSACELLTPSGPITFSNFSLDQNFAFGGAFSLPDNTIYVTPIGQGTDSPGFQFSARDTQTLLPLAFSVVGTGQYILVVRYEADQGANLIGSTRAFVNAAATCNGPQCGSASVTKDIFFPPPAPATGGIPSASINVNDVQVISAPKTFGPFPTFGVRDTVTIQGNNASSTMTSFGNDFQTPEPATLGMAGMAMVALALVGRRRKRS